MLDTWKILNLLLECNLHQLLIKPILWSVIGLLVGTLAGVFIVLLMRKWGCFTFKGWGAPFFKWLAAGLCLTIFIITMTYIGFLEGFIQGMLSVQNGKIGQEINEQTAKMGATILESCYFIAPSNSSSSNDFSPEKLREFLAAMATDSMEMDVKDFDRRLGMFDQDGVKLATDRAMQVVYEHWPNLKESGSLTVAKEWTEKSVIGVIQFKFKNEALGYGKKYSYGLLEFLEVVFKGLPEAAAQQGNPNTITHQELIQYIQKVGLVQFLMNPWIKDLRVMQGLTLLLMVPLLALPPLTLCLIEKVQVSLRRKKNQQITT